MTKLNVLELKKQTIDSDKNRARKAVIDVVSGAFNAPVTSHKQAQDLLVLNAIKDIEGAEAVAFNGGYFTKSEAEKLNLIE